MQIYQKCICFRFLHFRKVLLLIKQPQRHMSITVLGELISRAQHHLINIAHSPLIEVTLCQWPTSSVYSGCLDCIAMCLHSKSRGCLINLLFSVVQFVCSSGALRSWFCLLLLSVSDVSEEWCYELNQISNQWMILQRSRKTSLVQEIWLVFLFIGLICKFWLVGLGNH